MPSTLVLSLCFHVSVGRTSTMNMMTADISARTNVIREKRMKSIESAAAAAAVLCDESTKKDFSPGLDP
ncbi:hypothetical protein RHGRI_037559 [Rhododendron griersonianum]|uniref:Secreted protein n=1 Tax=Rhododendron griersonianum TaxID=479676 RepID=A0AAV6HXV4_9ERIC|nr:hypothetical protein RHGRI_037559 [Rhododendron griersonianum]